MKALSFFFLLVFLFAGCASPQMTEDDKFLWSDEPPTAGTETAK